MSTITIRMFLTQVGTRFSHVGLRSELDDALASRVLQPPHRRFGPDD
jgi:hypothetical protein